MKSTKGGGGCLIKLWCRSGDRYHCNASFNRHPNVWHLSCFTAVNASKFISATIIVCTRGTLTLDNFSLIASNCISITSILPSTVAYIGFQIEIDQSDAECLILKGFLIVRSVLQHVIECATELAQSLYLPLAQPPTTISL